MIHNANHLRPNRDGLKVGGHQASSASVATLMTALYFDVLRPQDRVAVKPHASPVFHAIQYLLGRQTREKLERFRALRRRAVLSVAHQGRRRRRFLDRLGRARRRHDRFACLVQDYLRLQGLLRGRRRAPGRMIALAGDAELDEGNIFEALLEGWKHDVRNLWWIIDYNRQSLDAVVSRPAVRAASSAMFEMMGWRVVTLKYGQLLEAAFAAPRRRRAAAVDRRLPELALFGAGLQGRRGLARASAARPRPASPASASSSTSMTTTALRRADDQPRRPRHGDGARRLPRASTTTGRPASSPTRSRASACPSPATRTTMPG